MTNTATSPLRVAVIGSRNYPCFDHKQSIVRLIDSLPFGTIVVTGGAAGVDRLAEGLARFLGYSVEIHTPESVIAKNPGMNYGSACVIRDKRIVDVSDQIYAYWTKTSRGTAHGLRHALAIDRQITVFGPDGQQMTETEVRECLAELDFKGTPTRKGQTPTHPTKPAPAPKPVPATSLFGGDV